MRKARSHFHIARLAAILLALGAWTPAPAVGGDGAGGDWTDGGRVVLSEIHYNPPEGGFLEYVELHNPEVDPVDLSGWSFEEGIRFDFPEGTVLEAGAYLVVCQDRDEFLRAFALDGAGVLGNFTGSLANDGEEVSLVDRDGSEVESLIYDDSPPWDGEADGYGPSLERICPSFPPENPANWKASSSGHPSPLGPGEAFECPPPGLPNPAIAITEIQYHPLGDADLNGEYVEIRNNTAAPIDLSGHAFTAGIEYVFEESLVLAPGAYLVIARDKDSLRSATGIDNVVGNFTGQLSNDGERITLSGPMGALVDSVRYSDDGNWPVAADGLGASLEKVLPSAPSDDPASWREAGPGRLGEWHEVSVGGIATSSRLLVFLDAEGEMLLDDVVVEDPAVSGVNHVPNGDFAAGVDGWLFKGNHADCVWEPQGDLNGGGALKIISRGKGSGSTNGIYIDLLPELVRTAGPTYRLAFRYRHVTGSKGLTCKISGATPSRGMYWVLAGGSYSSPGEANTVDAPTVPPFIGPPGRSPREPRSTDPVEISASVRATQGLASVTLAYKLDGTGEEFALPMAPDPERGPNAWSCTIPPQVHNTIVTYVLRAEDTTGAATRSPPESDPTGVHGYYIDDLRPESPLAVYRLLLDHTSRTAPRTILASLNCQVYRQGSFAYRGDLYWGVGIRQRGQSVCGSTKPYLKVRFQRGREFQGQRKLNLQSLWTDKSLVRESLAWNTFRDVGMPYCREEFVRLHVNGKYFGLYGALEHPDARFLERNRLPPEGNLYKAVASTEDLKASYVGSYEKKTNENGDFADITAFLNGMHATARNKLIEFFTQNLDVDRVIDYQLAQTLTNNSDYPHKNHYLYHDTVAGKWMVLTWDMDLSFGKLWDGTYGGVLHDKMHTPGTNPWYTTTVDGGLGNHLLDKLFYQSGTWFRRAYITRLWDALQEKYTESFFDARLEEFRDLLLEEQAEDIAFWGRSAATADDRTAPKDFEPNLERVRQHVKARRAYLLNYLTTRHRFTGHDRMKITEVFHDPPGSDEALEFVELWNPLEKEIAVGGWSLEGVGYIFPPETTVAAGEVLIVAADPAAFTRRYGPIARVFGPWEGRLDNDVATLRLKDAGPDYPATVDFLRVESSGDWPRGANGTGRSFELDRVTIARDNDPGANWRVSRSLWGSPGRIEGVTPDLPLYRRGDPNSDRKVNVSDAVVLLLYLFQGTGEPACLQSGDVDASGGVGITDPIALLQALFLPGGSPGISLSDDCVPGDPDLCSVANCNW